MVFRTVIGDVRINTQLRIMPRSSSIPSLTPLFMNLIRFRSVVYCIIQIYILSVIIRALSVLHIRDYVLWDAVDQLHVLVVQLYYTLMLTIVLTRRRMTTIPIYLRNNTCLLVFRIMLRVCILGLIMEVVTSLLVIRYIRMFNL